MQVVINAQLILHSSFNWVPRGSPLLFYIATEI